MAAHMFGEQPTYMRYVTLIVLLVRATAEGLYKEGSSRWIRPTTPADRAKIRQMVLDIEDTMKRRSSI